MSNLFFHIHYCKCRRFHDPGRYAGRITRTLQHHALIFFTEGKGNIMIDNKKYLLKAGMLFYIGPEVLHSIDLDTKEPISFLSVHFSYASVSFNDNSWAVSDAVKTLSLHTAQELKDYYHIEDLFKKLVTGWEAKLPGYEFITKTFLQQLLIAIYQSLRKQNQNYSISLKIEKVIQYMQQNVNNKVTLYELSALVHVSSFYLSRAFKEITGYAVIEYFNKLKMDKAKELLIEGDKKVKEVARELGFTDEFYFSRVFKKTEGVSPSEFYSKNVHGV